MRQYYGHEERILTGPRRGKADMTDKTKEIQPCVACGKEFVVRLDGHPRKHLGCEYRSPGYLKETLDVLKHL